MVTTWRLLASMAYEIRLDSHYYGHLIPGRPGQVFVFACDTSTSVARVIDVRGVSMDLGVLSAWASAGDPRVRVIQRAASAAGEAMVAGLGSGRSVERVGLVDGAPLANLKMEHAERRTTSAGPAEFAFVSTTARVSDVRLFMRTFPGILSAEHAPVLGSAGNSRCDLTPGSHPGIQVSWRRRDVCRRTKGCHEDS